jgi:hypothetical protein
MSTNTLLTDLVRRQTATSVLGVFSRTIDKVAEDLAQELLREPEFRDQLRALVRAAFVAALDGLQQPAPPDPREERSASIEALRLRIEMLEQQRRQTPPPPPAGGSQ